MSSNSKQQRAADPVLTVTYVKASELDRFGDDLDDPFAGLLQPPLPTAAKSRSQGDLPALVRNTPVGDELCDAAWADTPTRVLSWEETEGLLSQVRETKRSEHRSRSGIHTRPTVRSMAAATAARPVLELELDLELPVAAVSHSSGRLSP